MRHLGGRTFETLRISSSLKHEEATEKCSLSASESPWFVVLPPETAQLE